MAAGFKCQDVADKASGCRVIINPFFDITGINATIWFARECFDDDILMVHGDLVFPDELFQAMMLSQSKSFIAYDSRILDPKEINVRVDAGRVVRFGVNFADFSGAYVGVMKFSRPDAGLFIRLLDERIRRGFNDRRTYYFAFIRRMINEHHIRFDPLDCAGHDWVEIDYPRDLEKALALYE